MVFIPDRHYNVFILLYLWHTATKLAAYVACWDFTNHNFDFNFLDWS